MMYKINLRDRGFTLIEILLVLVIAAIISSFIFGWIVHGFRSLDSGSSQAEMQQWARIIDNIISSEIRNSKEIDINTISGENVYFIEINNNRLIYGDGESVFIENLEEIKFYVKSGDPDNLLSYSINLSSRDNVSSYEYINNVYLNNTQYDKSEVIINGVSKLYYSKYE